MESGRNIEDMITSAMRAGSTERKAESAGFCLMEKGIASTYHEMA
jgi:hypothetical protein